MINVYDGKKVRQTRVSKDSCLEHLLSKGNHFMMGEYGETATIPGAEPQLIKIDDKAHLVYTFFKLGMKVSVMVYSLEQKRDVV